MVNDDVLREIVKITIVGENDEERETIKKVFTRGHPCRSAVLKSPYGAHDFGRKYFSKDDEEYFVKCGFEVKVREFIHHRGISTIAGMSVVVRAKNLKDYDTGCTVSITCTGKTSEELQCAKDNAEFKMYSLLNLYNIPVSRMCIESNLACVYKFK